MKGGEKKKESVNKQIFLRKTGKEEKLGWGRKTERRGREEGGDRERGRS